jgi:hypothetical protein
MTARVYTTRPGAEIAIGDHGIATNDAPVIVPDAVAQQLEYEIRGERPNPLAGQPGEPATLKYARARTDIRVERIAPALAAKTAPAEKAAPTKPTAEVPKNEDAQKGGR